MTPITYMTTAAVVAAVLSAGATYATMAQVSGSPAHRGVAARGVPGPRGPRGPRGARGPAGAAADIRSVVVQTERFGTITCAASLSGGVLYLSGCSSASGPLGGHGAG
jgi:hypothetical protein